MKKEGFVKRWMRVQEVADHFGYSRSRIYEIIHQGKLAVWHPQGIAGKGMRISIESIQRLEAEGMVPPEEFNK